MEMADQPKISILINHAALSATTTRTTGVLAIPGMMFGMMFL